MEPRGNEDQPRSSRFDANRASSAHAGFGPSPYESQQALTPSARAIFSSVSARGMRFPISVSVIADDATPAAAARPALRGHFILARIFVPEEQIFQRGPSEGLLIF